MYQIPDAASYASMHYLNTILNRRCGGSTGTNFYTVLKLIEEMKNNGESGSIVSMICDSGERYLNSYYSEAWLAEKGFLDDVKIYQDRITKFINSGAPLK
jgi:cysteine synthase A